MNKRVVLIGCGALAVFALGLLVGKGLPGGNHSGNQGLSSQGGLSAKSGSSGSFRGGDSEGDESSLKNGGERPGASGRRPTLMSVTELMKEGDLGSRYAQLSAMLDRAAPEDFAPLLDEIMGSGFEDILGDEIGIIVSAWARRDPYAATAYLIENDSPDRMQYAAMAAWASEDPAAAEQWARDNHEGEGANDWMVGVIRGLAAASPEKAGDLIAELPRSREQVRAMHSTLPFVMERGEAYAASWIENLSEGNLQSSGAQWMARKMADLDPEKAASWVASLGTKEARREASAEVAVRFAKDDLASAQSWVSSLPENTRTEAAEGVVSVMAKDDVRGAIAWLERQGDDMDYDGAWVDLVRNGFENDPGVALVGALRLANEDWREKYTGGYLSKWMKQDEEAARSWVNDYMDYLPERLARRYAPKPPKKPKKTTSLDAWSLEAPILVSYG